MAFEDLTENQRRLVVELIEELATGNYSSEFWAVATMGKGWFIRLQGQGEAGNRELIGFQETDLHALADEGYIQIIHKMRGFAGSLKPKAEREYALLREPAESATLESIRQQPEQLANTPKVSRWRSFSMENPLVWLVFTVIAALIAKLILG